ncbi:MAG: hypothetical protein GQ570_10345 [Helicobacteraceae bacterium]|nr:hypothetical protein [Helicobacteraceae bacterium]
MSAKEAGSKASTKGWQKIAIVGEWRGHNNGAFKLSTEDLTQILKNFEDAKATEIVVDYEHSTLYADKAEAAGWIKELKVENDALYAKVEWLDDAVKLIKDKKYKYLSPVINPSTIDQVSGENIGWSLHSVALTNKPFFEELDELRINKAQQANASEALNAESYKNSIQNKGETVNEDEKKEFEKLKEQNKALKAEIAELKKAKAKAKVDEAVAAKKIHPDQAESMMAFSQNDPEGFDKFIAAAKTATQAPASDDMYAASSREGSGGEAKYDVVKLGGIE